MQKAARVVRLDVCTSLATARGRWGERRGGGRTRSLGHTYIKGRRVKGYQNEMMADGQVFNCAPSATRRAWRGPASCLHT